MEIKKLTPELVDDYLNFFDTTPHDDEVDEHKCYCVCWSSADSEGEDFSTAESRRKLAQKYAVENRVQGYLAYENGAVVGWCNANTKSECLRCLCGRMYLEPLKDDESAGMKIKSVFCFVVAPDMRRRGIAGKLLERVCEDAKNEGFDAVEAYPIKEFVSERYDYMGPAKLYEKLGFAVHLDLGDRLVVRKSLK